VSATPPTSAAFIEEIRAEFPSFEIRKKRTSALQRAIGVFLRMVTLGGMKTYVSNYHTVLFGTLWVPDAWDAMRDLDKVILLRHERVHLRQRARMGDLGMAFLYLVPFFPIGLAYGRARIEWEAYEETIRATVEFQGEASAESLKPEIVARFVGPDYGFMWPFAKVVSAWFDEAFTRICGEVQRRE